MAPYRQIEQAGQDQELKILKQSVGEQNTRSAMRPNLGGNVAAFAMDGAASRSTNYPILLMLHMATPQ